MDGVGVEFSDEDYICVRTWRARHVGGTKDYHALQLANLSRNAIVVLFRWGKADQAGEIQAERFNSTRQAQKTFETKVREKRFNRGYSENLSSNLEERKVRPRDLSKYLDNAEISYLQLHHPNLFGPTEIDFPVDIPEEPAPPKFNPYLDDPEWVFSNPS